MLQDCAGLGAVLTEGDDGSDCAVDGALGDGDFGELNVCPAALCTKNISNDRVVMVGPCIFLIEHAWRFFMGKPYHKQ